MALFKIMIIFVVIFSCITPLHAYIDPGTGSYVLQLLVAGILGSLYALKVYWRSLRHFFGSLFSKKK